MGAGVGVIVALSFVTMAATTVSLLLVPGAQVAGLISGLFTVGIVALIGAISWPGRVEVTDTELVAHGGRWNVERVALTDIVSATPTMNPLASPFAWSLDRVSIRSGGLPLLVSTTDNEALLAAIAGASPSLALVDGAVRRV